MSPCCAKHYVFSPLLFASFLLLKIPSPLCYSWKCRCRIVHWFWISLFWEWKVSLVSLHYAKAFCSLAIILLSFSFWTWMDFLPKLMYSWIVSVSSFSIFTFWHVIVEHHLCFLYIHHQTYWIPLLLKLLIR